jgi:hypothetical protein
MEIMKRKCLITENAVLNFFLLLIILLSSCGKDPDTGKPCFGCGRCKDFPEYDGYTFATFYSRGINRFAPCFNPKNHDEFVFYTIDYSTSKRQLVIGTISTKSERVILEDVRIGGQPKWGINGLIVFSSISDYKLYVISPDGKNYRAVTEIGGYLYPDWLDGEVVTAQYSERLSPPFFYSEVNINRWILDLPEHQQFRLGTNNALKEKAYLINAESPNIAVWSSSKNETITSKKSNGFNRIEGIAWHPNNKDIYYSTVKTGLFKINKEGKRENRLKKACDSRQYRYLSISADGQVIIVERVDAEQDENGNRHEKYDIVMMDINGNNEKKVFDN